MIARDFCSVIVRRFCYTIAIAIVIIPGRSSVSIVTSPEMLTITVCFFTVKIAPSKRVFFI